MKSRLYVVFTLLVLSTLVASAQQSSMNCPMHEKHRDAQTKISGKPEEKSAVRHAGMTGMSERGDEAMGFSQNRTTHHFRLLDDGGAIEVEVNDLQDAASRDQIRMHLHHISQMFSEGNFETPMFIHDQTPPGVPIMRRLTTEIKYNFEPTPRGGRVRIKTSSAEALAAVYDFLRFQIREHETGDPLDVKN